MPEHFDERAATWDDDSVRTQRAADVAGQILDRITLTPESHVLDFGSGTGLLGFHFLYRAASVTFADPSEGMLEQVRAKLQAGGHETGRTYRLDPADGGLPDRYDAILSLMTLHHVDDPAATLSMLTDHLEPGGWLAICDLDAEDGSFHDGTFEGSVHHGFHREKLVGHMEALGLVDVQVSTAYVMRKDGPAGPRYYPLFLLTARSTLD